LDKSNVATESSVIELRPDNLSVNIDGKGYVINELSNAAKLQLTNVQAVDRLISNIKQQQAIMQTARNAYINALKNEIAR
jgi:hypothetical protein